MTIIILLSFVVAAVALLFGVPQIRYAAITKPIMKSASRSLPSMGKTERIALEAGSVWWEGDLFSGKPDWSRLLSFEIKPLSDEERTFIDGPLHELCEMLDDWQIQQDRDLPPEVWNFIKEKGFLGMIIPREHGGLGFSAHAHSVVVARLSTRSVTAAVTVMVPNSLGPGELLLHYGTDTQKNHYLPRLARGEDIPCFALTEPAAGSDAANGRSCGVVCRGVWDGEEILGMRLTFNKRYITLAPIATVVGLAFRLVDPERLLGGDEDIGITCALLPRDTPGLRIGNRHDPMGIPFQNGPVRGTDVFVPLDYIIGGRDGAGQGWRMLMESLAAGRSISLPSQAVGAAQLAARATSAYAVVREQFGLPIARFEGVRERLARIAGHAYFMEATRRLAFGAVDAGERPSVVSAIVKAYLTEGSRTCINDAMDIHAGSAICRGPANLFSRAYMTIPIGITVEGANILTRSLIIFGQGAIRCHPYVLEEMEALATRNVSRFERAVLGHLSHVISNSGRAFILAVTGSRFAKAPAKGPEVKHFRRLARFSAAFALIADVALLCLGGTLKRKEYLSGRLADALAWMFIASAVLKHFHDRGRPENERPFIEWALGHAFEKIEGALRGVVANLPNRVIAGAVRILTFPLCCSARARNDRLTDAVATALTSDVSLRDALTSDVFVPHAGEHGLGALESALVAVRAASAARSKLEVARRSGAFGKASQEEMIAAAFDVGIVSTEEYKLLKAAERSREKVIQVSDFDSEAYASLR